jgi:hypothetical protein
LASDRQLQSVALARKLIERRSVADSVKLDASVIQSKAEGVAYALRNASDYFQAKEGHNVSQRVLNLYYGSPTFAFAEYSGVLSLRHFRLAGWCSLSVGGC